MINIKNNSNFVVTFIDFKVSFDSISHKHLDSALAKAGFASEPRDISCDIQSDKWDGQSE